MSALTVNKEEEKRLKGQGFLNNRGTDEFSARVITVNGKVISSQRLFEEVWHEEYLKNSNNTVMVHIRHLREKLSKPTGKSDLIKTVWGVGYKIEE